MQNVLRHVPTRTGTATVSLRAIAGDNGSVVPAQALTFTGQATFNSTGAWSSSADSVTAPASATLDFGNRTPGQVADRVVYLNNTGTNGSLKAAFEITGDADQFKIMTVKRVNTSGSDGGSGYNYGECGAIIAADRASSAPCTAIDPSINYYKQIQVTLRHAPTRTGTATVSLRAIAGDNGSVVPAQALTFTGQATFNSTGAWSSSADSVTAPASATLDFGNRTPGQVADRVVYLNNTGTNGSLKAAFEITGDADQFKIMTVKRVNTSGSDGGSGYNYGECGAIIAADRASSAPCTAIDPSINYYKQIQVTLRHAPTRTGTATVSLRAIAGDNGSVVPAQMLTFTGSGT